MKTFKYLFIFLGCMFISPLVTKADCSYERLAELSRLASNVQFSYVYNFKSGEQMIDDVEFTVYITNITDDIYVVDSFGDVFSSSEEKWKMYDNDQTIDFKIYSNDASCRGEKILTAYLNLPQYNRFFQSEGCLQNPGLELCSMWRDTSAYTLDDFTAAVFNEREKLKIDVENDENVIVKFFNDNKIQIILVVGAIVLMIVLGYFYKRIRR